MQALRRAWPGARGLVRIGTTTASRYGRLGGSQFSAAISYRALFSLVPLATFAATVFATVLQGNSSVRRDVVNAISEQLHLSDSGVADLDQLVAAVPSPWSVAGLVTLGIALWGATGVMSSIQKTLAVVFDGGEGRSFVRGRLVSALLVLGVLGLMLVAVALSVLEGVAKQVSENVQGAMDWEPYGVGLVFGIVLPLLLTFGVFFALMYRLPRTRPSLPATVIGAGAGAIGFQAVQIGLAWYLSGPADLSALYGSASAVIAFLLTIYLSATAFVLAAVLTSVLDDERSASVQAVTSSP
jgi:membrane protein